VVQYLSGLQQRAPVQVQVAIIRCGIECSSMPLLLDHEGREDRQRLDLASHHRQLACGLLQTRLLRGSQFHRGDACCILSLTCVCSS